MNRCCPYYLDFPAFITRVMIRFPMPHVWYGWRDTDDGSSPRRFAQTPKCQNQHKIKCTFNPLDKHLRLIDVLEPNIERIWRDYGPLAYAWSKQTTDYGDLGAWKSLPEVCLHGLAWYDPQGARCWRIAKPPAGEENESNACDDDLEHKCSSGTVVKL